MSARYLIRFDDICPTMNWAVWRDIEKILVDADVKPLLAVVPENRDSALDVSAPEANFWERVREWQRRGWAVGLHGYQHRYVTRERGLVGLNDRSEFAGLPRAEQTAKLTRAVAVFRDQGVRPDLWIAPGHSFDAATVAGLKEVGIDVLSDGFFLSPHLDEQGMLWVPQQLWGFHYRPFGLWTVCYHHNGWSDGDRRQFAREVAAYRARITSLAEVVAAPAMRRKARHDSLVRALLFSTLRLKRWVRGRLDGGRAGPAARPRR